MSIGSAVRQGLSITRRSWTAAGILFLVNLVLATIAGFPIYRGISDFTGHSLMGRELARGLSGDWLTDFTFNNPRGFDHYATVIFLLGIASLALNSILAGGVLTHFKAPDVKYSAGDLPQHGTLRLALAASSGDRPHLLLERLLLSQ
jgi:hypothetical protein